MATTVTVRPISPAPVAARLLVNARGRLSQISMGRPSADCTMYRRQVFDRPDTESMARVFSGWRDRRRTVIGSFGACDALMATEPPMWRTRHNGSEEGGRGGSVAALVVAVGDGADPGLDPGG